jgi:CheY-like chemotaxis protein
MFRSRAAGKGLQLRFERTPEVPQYVRTDASKLRQVLINLLSNAVKFTQEGEVSLRCDGDLQPMFGAESESDERVHLVFQVADTGPGIAPEEQAHLFKAFGQTASGRQAQEGTGLGLAISRTFIQLLGGDLTVDSDVARGSVFTFDVFVRLAEASEVPTRPSGRRVVGVEPGQPVYRLLVVEDRLENRRLLVKMLEPWGFEVREASNGQEGVAVWEQWDPHLIWMDMRMPVMDGYEAATRIKSTTKGQATVVVALTASVFEEQRRVVLSSGCDDFVRKPFREQEIADVLSQHLGVRFLYDDPLPAASPQADDRTQEGLPPEALAALPAHWREDLHEAAQRADMDAMLSLLMHIEADHAPLADRLEALIQDFRFGEIIAWTQPGEDV